MIINIHPSLLPKYGGKGMYGSRIHDKVIENNETETVQVEVVSEEVTNEETSPVNEGSTEPDLNGEEEEVIKWD